MFTEYVQASNITSVYCDNSKYVFSLMVDLVNGSVIPFLALTITSVVSFLSVIKMHRKMRNNQIFNSNQATETNSRDVWFGITIIALNFLFFIFKASNTVLKNFVLLFRWRAQDSYSQSDQRRGALFLFCLLFDDFCKLL